ncbi:benzoate-CoA ligase family protein [Maritimibacter sp. 55A14]|uniref:benzoate-CoA ligase family protein n=1 Tax=Maritimibacter sp. 55A14 TaxID=2174844 RepID=UPI0018EE4F77|nr:benzoate-CoA ligase family protein [Maritimibacter sp. 55A14]
MSAPTPEGLAAGIGFDLPERYNAARLLWDNLAARADAPAILHDGGVWSYRVLAAEAARIGNALLGAGARPGDRILMFMDDEPAYPAAIIGAMRAGLVPMLINTLSPPELIRFFLEDSGAVAAVVSDAFAGLFGPETCAGTACGAVLNAGARPWADAPPVLDEHPTTRRDMAFWMYSSGSTGRPKGVVHKHEDAAYSAQSYARDVLKIGPGDICFSIPKIFFAYGFGNSVTFPMAAGAAAVLMSGRPTPARAFEQIARHRPTILFGLPTLYTALVRDPAAEGADLSSVRLCVSAAEVLSAEIAGAWRDSFGHAIVEGLGSTEMLHIYLTNDERVQKQGSAGRVVPGYAVRLIAPDGHEAVPGEEGVMQVMGLSGAEYYWNRPDKTVGTMRAGWIDTGDRFVADAEGYYFFRGRADDLVKVSGQWVWPLEIELALNEHPDVVEACVQAVEMADCRMTLVAWVALAEGCGGDAAMTRALQAHAKAALLPHKYPREIVYLDALPKTGTGKIDRQGLRAAHGAGA